MSAKYWTQHHHEQMTKAKNVAELLVVANSVIDSIPRPLVYVSGPISTGGKGSVAENLKVFRKTIAGLEKNGLNVFNYLPLHRKIAEFSAGHDGYFTPVLDELFLPIFESKKIDKILFIPGWETSKGAKWEHETAVNLKIDIDFL